MTARISRLQLAAYVGIENFRLEPPRAGQLPKVILNLHNYGQTPACNVSSYGAGFLGETFDRATAPDPKLQPAAGLLGMAPGQPTHVTITLDSAMGGHAARRRAERQGSAQYLWRHWVHRRIREQPAIHQVFAGDCRTHRGAQLGRVGADRRGQRGRCATAVRYRGGDEPSARTARESRHCWISLRSSAP